MHIHELVNKSDYEWYKELFTNYQRKKISDDEIDEIIYNSMDCAEEVYSKFAKEIESYTTKNEVIKKLIGKYGTKVTYNMLDNSDKVIAAYDSHDNKLVIYNHSITTLYTQIQKLAFDDILNRETLENLVLSHELYHAIEMNEEDIYTYSEMYTSKFLWFTNKRRLSVAGEIGAFHFSKLVNDLDFSPCIIGSIYEVDNQ